MGIEKIRAAIAMVMPHFWSVADSVDAAEGDPSRVVEGHGERSMRIENVPANVAAYLETVQPSAMLGILRDYDLLSSSLAARNAPVWRDIDTAPRGKHVVVVSARFPVPHEAMLYDDGWHTWGVSGAYRDDPYTWTDLPEAPSETAAPKQAVIVVWDKDGKFFQNWTADYLDGDGIAHGKRIAAQIGGTFAVLGGGPTRTSEHRNRKSA